MARFLFTVWPFAGHYYPQVAIARALRARGHLCAFYTGPSACEVLHDEGFCCFPFVAVDEESVQRIMSSPQRGSLRWRGLAQYRATFHDWLIGTLPSQVSDLEIVLDEWRPDVIASDPTMFSPMVIFHETRRLPVAIASFIPACTIPGPDAPPFGPGLPRPRDWRTRGMAYLAKLGLELFGGRLRRGVNELRGEHGLAPLSVPIYAHMGRMPLYLVPAAPDFDYQRGDLPSSVRYVGPYLWNKPRGRPSPDWLTDVPRDEPWIHVTEGTMHNAEPFVLRAAAKGLADRPLQVIMTTGGGCEPSELDFWPVAENVHIASWVSHSDLLPLVDVLVTTGGAGTVLAALSAGVPLVIIPTEWDKPEIAQRVVESGAGLRIGPRRCTPERIRDAVLRVLEEPSFRRNAKRLAAVFAGYGGAERAAELLEELSSGSEVDTQRLEGEKA